MRRVRWDTWWAFRRLARPPYALRMVRALRSLARLLLRDALLKWRQLVGRAHWDRDRCEEALHFLYMRVRAFAAFRRWAERARRLRLLERATTTWALWRAFNHKQAAFSRLFRWLLCVREEAALRGHFQTWKAAVARRRFARRRRALQILDECHFRELARRRLRCILLDWRCWALRQSARRAALQRSLAVRTQHHLRFALQWWKCSSRRGGSPRRPRRTPRGGRHRGKYCHCHSCGLPCPPSCTFFADNRQHGPHPSYRGRGWRAGEGGGAEDGKTRGPGWDWQGGGAVAGKVHAGGNGQLRGRGEHGNVCGEGGGGGGGGGRGKGEGKDRGGKGRGGGSESGGSGISGGGMGTEGRGREDVLTKNDGMR